MIANCPLWFAFESKDKHMKQSIDIRTRRANHKEFGIVNDTLSRDSSDPL